jgi:cell division protein FtsB
MKTRFTNLRRARRSQGGSAVVVMLALLAVMLMLIAANVATLNRLNREVKGLEKQQMQRLDPSLKPPLHPFQAATNSPAER